MTHYCIQRLSIGKQPAIHLHHPFLQAELLLGHGSGRHGSERGNLRIAEVQADKNAKLAVGRRKPVSYTHLNPQKVRVISVPCAFFTL